MNKSIVILILGLILEIFLAVSPALPYTRELWVTDGDKTQYSPVAMMVGLQFVVLTSCLGLIYLVEGHRANAAVSELSEALAAPKVTKLRDDDFYSGFLAAAKRAKSAVKISYFAPFPPTDVPDRDRASYYRAMQALMKKNDKVKFKRLVRHTDKNAPWVAEMIRAFEGCSNIDIGVIKGDLDAGREMGLALSVQLVDQEDAWLVAVAGHERDGEWRDMHVKSRAVSEAVSQYYSRIWTNAEELLKSGVITPEGTRYLEARENAEND